MIPLLLFPLILLKNRYKTDIPDRILNQELRFIEVESTDKQQRHQYNRLLREIFIVQEHMPPLMVHEDDAIHIIAKYKGTPVGACRLRESGEKIILERIGILAKFRHKQIGMRMFYFVLGRLQEQQ